MPAEQEPVIGLPHQDIEATSPEKVVLRGAGTLAQLIGVAAAEKVFKEQEELERFNLMLAWERFGRHATQSPTSLYYRPRR
jgi:hypothetical protein